jgi:hypothetical protein
MSINLHPDIVWGDTDNADVLELSDTEDDIALDKTSLRCLGRTGGNGNSVKKDVQLFPLSDDPCQHRDASKSKRALLEPES